VEKASKVCRMVGANDSARIELIARHVLDEDLLAVREEPLARRTERKAPPTLPVDPGVLNTDIDAEHLLDSLASSGYGRLCFHGAPGTGKTAFAAEIARRLDRPLHVTQAADILGPYVGMTERNVATAFARAEREGAVLLLDEADSFLQNRRRAERHWQVTEVNQFLTSLERHEGYVVCTTNLVEGLDPAALRRFDFKVGFGYMDEVQAKRMVSMVLRALRRGRVKVSEIELDRLEGVELVPGDFALALRQGAMCGVRADARTVVDAVLAEARMRAPATKGPIGFV